VFGYCIVVSLTAFSVICNKTFYKVYTLLSHTLHHTKSPLGSRGRDNERQTADVCAGVIAHVHPETSISKQQTHQSGEPFVHNDSLLGKNGCEYFRAVFYNRAKWLGYNVVQK